MYYSQAGQDEWVYSLSGTPGFFVDVGAYDGIQTSNTYFLEQRGWRGICIEANEDVFKTLCNNRQSVNVQKAVTDFRGVCTFGVDRIGVGRPVMCDTLNNILEQNNCPDNIDYLSLDIEGEELKVLSCFDFERWAVKLITVEHNLYCDGPEKKDALYELLTSKGFVRVKDNVLCLDPNPLYFNQPFEDWYCHLNYC